MSASSATPWDAAAVSAAAKVILEAVPILGPAAARKLGARVYAEADTAKSEAMDKWLASQRRQQNRDAAEAARERADRERFRRQETAPHTPEGRPAHSILGCAATATPTEIRDAWRKRAKRCHPDTGGSTEMMAELNAARDAMLRAAGATNPQPRS